MHGEVAYSSPKKTDRFASRTRSAVSIGGEEIKVKETNGKPQSTPVQEFLPEDVEAGKDAVYMKAVVPTK